MSGPVLAFDQSGTQCRAVLFSADRRVLASAYEELTPVRAKPGQVEFDPEDIWATAIASCRAACVSGRVDPSTIAAIGISADPDTVVAWDRETGKAIYNAIAGADRRTDGQCRALREAGVEPLIRARTGLRLDPSRGATRWGWILDNVVAARARAENGDILFGGVGTFLLWRLTEGRVHATDATSAASTLLFNVQSQAWDSALLDVFSVPVEALPAVFDNATYFGAVDASQFGGAGPIGVHGMAAPAQAALMGQGGLRPGALSLSFGDGCAALLTITRPRPETEGQTITAARINGKMFYAVLGANGAAVDAYRWARRAFGLAETFSQADRLVKAADPEAILHIVPARLTAGAPWFHGAVAGLIHGVENGTSLADFVRASLESGAFAARDLVEHVGRSAGSFDDPPPPRVSGGIAASDWAMQFLSDILKRPLERSSVVEAAAFGVAWLAGMHGADWPDAEGLVAGLATDRRFEPQLSETRRMARIDGWHRAVKLAMSAESPRPASASGQDRSNNASDH